jgi:Ca-activated chloride channel family protein
MKRLLLTVLQVIGCWAAFPAGLIVVDRHIPLPGPIHPPPMPPWWQPWRPEPYAFAPIEVVSIEVKTRITDQVAVTTIEQEFRNPNAARIEGSFVCPLPKGAQIDKFTMDIDGKPCEAELLPAEKARKIYDDIVRSMKDPALLEYAGRDMFRVRIFPFEPNGKRRVTLKYTELLKSDSGLVSHTLPLSAGKFSARAVSKVSVSVELESGKPLKSIYSPTHEVDIKRSGAKRATVAFESDERAVPSDFALYFSPKGESIGLDLLTYREPGQDGYFLLMASPGVDVAEREAGAKDIIFVLDTSGSMAGKKLEQAKKALEFCIENLNEKDRFEIIRFATEVEGLFDGLTPATQANREKALQFAKDLRATGGTAIDEALRQALALGRTDGGHRDRKGASSIIIFLTDGRPTVGESHEERIVANVKDRNSRNQRVFCFGIGNDVNTHLLDKITEETRAFSQYVLPEEDLEVKVSSFYSKIKEPVLANPELKITGEVRVSKMYPSSLPDLFKGEQVVLAGRYKGDGDALFTLAGTVNGTEREFTFEEPFPESATKHDFLPRLWATRRVGYLLDEIRLRGENAELKEEITELARKFGIVTPYTSYLIVEDEDRRQVRPDQRLMRDFENDRAARRASQELWSSMQSAKDGVAATSVARGNQAFKQANAPSAANAGAAIESQRALGLTSSGGMGGGGALSEAAKGKLRLAQYTQQAQFVNGRTFFQNNNQWVDSAVQKQTNAPIVNIKFGSVEYFELAGKNASAGPWLALGRNVQFVLGNTIYNVQE